MVFAFLISLAFANPLLKSTYVFEVPKYSAEASFKKNLRKSIRSQLINLQCRNVIIGTPSTAKNPPAWAHHADNYQQLEVASANCIVLRKPQECDGVTVSTWLFEDLKSERDWVVCRKP